VEKIGNPMESVGGEEGKKENENLPSSPPIELKKK
jgi:hypothetical protein